MYIADFMPGDQIVYCGEANRQEIGGKIGVVHATVEGAEGTYIIEFPDSKNCDSYVIASKYLKPYVPSSRDNPGPAVSQRRRRSEDD